LLHGLKLAIAERRLSFLQGRLLIERRSGFPAALLIACD
jgi:hypothetical protein